MKRIPSKYSIFSHTTLICFAITALMVGNSQASITENPVMTISTTGIQLSVSWTAPEGVTGYKFLFAPYPYNGETIGEIELGNITSVAADLWDGASYHIAILAYDLHGSTALSNIEYFIIGSSNSQEVDNDGDGYSEAQGDCSDDNPSVFPGAIEHHDNQIDDDCDGFVDDNDNNFPPSNPLVGVFYYPWYENLSNGYLWSHWEQNSHSPPMDISSEYYPALGPYSSKDLAVIRQHFRWMREAKIGFIITSWWGRNSFEDRVVNSLLNIANEFGIKVAFHIEPFDSRSNETLPYIIEYLYNTYGNHPAFLRSGMTSYASSSSGDKGVFFLWLSEFANGRSGPAPEAYWKNAVDRIHGLPQGAIILADSVDPNWIEQNHFDGAYNYASFDTENAFQWRAALPKNAWYVPSIVPGFTAYRASIDSDVPYLSREDGMTYRAQWDKALEGPTRPDLITITSFNEWHEGTQIEPASYGKNDGKGYVYQDYGSLGENGYLFATKQKIEEFENHIWPELCEVTIRLSTTSDWTGLSLIDGASWTNISVDSYSASATNALFVNNELFLTQPLQDALDGNSVEIIASLSLTEGEDGTPIQWEIARGGLGETTIEIFIQNQLVTEFSWAGDTPKTVSIDPTLIKCPE